jgi:regulator of replication initiation timing
LKAQLDDLVAENSGLKAKTDELADEVARLKSESTKAQELARTRRIEAEAKEKRHAAASAIFARCFTW